MSVSLELLSLNIEHSKHLDLVVPFLAEQKPEVACIQELFECHIPLLSEALGAQCFFAPMTRYVTEHSSETMGIGIFSQLPITRRGVEWYRGDPTKLPALTHGIETTFNYKNLPLVSCDVEKDGEIFKIATTHFTWTPDGKPSDLQRHDMKKLLGLLDALGDFVLTGDFNAPRGGEIFGVLAERYKDNIPPRYVTSIDIGLHRAGKQRPEELADKMVDGIFSTPAYRVSDVKMISGVSDHCALTATVSRQGGEG